MSKILISWYSYSNDFMIEKHGSKSRNLGIVNEEGPLFNVHKHFWEYDKHILLNSNHKEEDKANFELLKSELSVHFKGHKIESTDISINDPINVSEIFSKLQPLLVEYNTSEIDIFISPGTPAMQTAWYLLGTSFRKNVTLFQLRPKEFTRQKLIPEKLIVALDSSVLPTNIIVAQKTIEEIKSPKDILITESIEPIYKKASLIALTDDVGCLILGENGTGKENLARYIHDNSNRKEKPFMAVNCAAYNDDLLRSELFGHEKGSFTGADDKKIGVFQAANGGTVFLDEIGDISPKMQVTLLRVLQEKKIQPVGSVKEIQINVRIISATNKDIETLCEEDKFRIDLFYRLAVIDLKLPALRERGKKDILALITYFNERLSEKYQMQEQLKISKEVLDHLLAYGYKGNVRELENIFIYFYTFCEGEIKMTDLPERVLKNNAVSLRLDDIQRQHIIKVFNLCMQKPIVTAKALGIHKDTLYRKLIEYGIR